MEITVTRKDYTDESTIGDFGIDNSFFCYSLELPWGNGANVHQVNCILPGRYEVIIDQSARFKRLMPHILNVPNRDSIRIHVGNFARDTEGCVLLGLNKEANVIGNSVVAFNRFFPMLQTALTQGKVFINIA